MSKLKIELISFAQTFVSTFLTVLAVAISQGATNEIMTNGFWAGVIIASARTAIKLTWQKALPEYIGGVKSK